MYDFLKSISDIIVESRSVSTRPTFTSTTTTQVKAILDMKLSFPGVQPSDCFHLFSTLFFMEKVEGRSMFATLVNDKYVQLKWLEMQYQGTLNIIFPKGKGIISIGLLRLLSVVVIGFSVLYLLHYFFSLFFIGRNYMLTMGVY